MTRRTAKTGIDMAKRIFLGALKNLANRGIGAP
jgi:hypothetical protein